MDAKFRANFINSIAGGKKVPCPECNTLNEPGSRFCESCGTPLVQKAPVVEETPFELVKEEPAFEPIEEKPAFEPVTEEPAFEPAEEKPAFEPAEEKPAFTPIKKKPEVKKEPAKVKPAPVVYEEEPSVFAQGLPEWDIVPPQVVVRRKRK